MSGLRDIARQIEDFADSLPNLEQDELESRISDIQTRLGYAIDELEGVLDSSRLDTFREVAQELEELYNSV